MKASQANTLDIPTLFLERMSNLLKAEYPAFKASLFLPSVLGLRINILKISAAGFSEISPWQLSPVPWCSSGFIVDTDRSTAYRTPPGKHAYHAAGLYYLQDPTAMAAAEILAPQPGEKVLDLAAAPGGKATHLAALMNNSGLLVTNEIQIGRYWDLAENIQRCGVINSVGTVSTPEKLAMHFAEYFDRVLVDAPCSGEGMFRKGDVARREWKPELVRGCALRQSNIIEQASLLVKPGGRLVYSTCTFSPEENESVIANFLAAHPEYDLEVIRSAAGSSPARPDWADLPIRHPVSRAIRYWPHQVQGEGHFIALLAKKDSSEKPSRSSRQKKWRSIKKDSNIGLDHSTQAIFDSFYQANLSMTFDPSRLAQVGSFIYFLPDPSPDLSALNVLHFGWFLGINQKGRFIPSHHLAMGIKRNQAFHSLSMTQEDERLPAYIRGETLPDPGEDAWVLVCVDDYPLGWAKRVKHVLKNYYPHGLRYTSRA